jgi:hypothetical protein
VLSVTERTYVLKPFSTEGKNNRLETPAKSGINLKGGSREKVHSDAVKLKRRRSPVDVGRMVCPIVVVPQARIGRRRVLPCVPKGRILDKRRHVVDSDVIRRHGGLSVNGGETRMLSPFHACPRHRHLGRRGTGRGCGHIGY